MGNCCGTNNSEDISPLLEDKIRGREEYENEVIEEQLDEELFYSVWSFIKYKHPTLSLFFVRQFDPFTRARRWFHFWSVLLICFAISAIMTSLHQFEENQCQIINECYAGCQNGALKNESICKHVSYEVYVPYIDWYLYELTSNATNATVANYNKCNSFKVSFGLIKLPVCIQGCRDLDNDYDSRPPCSIYQNNNESVPRICLQPSTCYSHFFISTETIFNHVLGILWIVLFIFPISLLLEFLLRCSSPGSCRTAKRCLTVRKVFAYPFIFLICLIIFGLSIPLGVETYLMFGILVVLNFLVSWLVEQGLQIIRLFLCYYFFHCACCMN